MNTVRWYEFDGEDWPIVRSETAVQVSEGVKTMATIDIPDLHLAFHVCLLCDFSFRTQDYANMKSEADAITAGEKMGNHYLKKHGKNPKPRPIRSARRGRTTPKPA